MKIISLNLQGFVNWDARKDALVEYLKSADADIIMFQEVVYLPGISPYTQVELLNQELGYAYEASSVTRLQPSPEYDVFREGLALLSKHPIVKTNTIILKQEEGDPHNRLVQFADIAVGDQTVRIANIHLSITDTQDYATPQLYEVLSMLDSKQETRIIAGDFNLATLDHTRATWEGIYRSSDEFEYISFPSDDKRIDYFLIPRHYGDFTAAVSKDGISDHRALELTLPTL